LLRRVCRPVSSGSGETWPVQPGKGALCGTYLPVSQASSCAVRWSREGLLSTLTWTIAKALLKQTTTTAPLPATAPPHSAALCTSVATRPPGPSPAACRWSPPPRPPPPPRRPAPPCPRQKQSQESGLPQTRCAPPPQRTSDQELQGEPTDPPPGAGTTRVQTFIWSPQCGLTPMAT
jgi:hypothetical protein